MLDFVSIPLFEFNLVIKLRNFGFERHWNTLRYFDKKKDMMSDLNISHGKMSDSVLLPLFRFTLVIKMRIFLIKKWCQIWLCPVKQCLTWLKLPSLCRIFGNKLRKMNFEFYQNSFCFFFQFRNMLWDQNLTKNFLFYLYFLILL